MSEVKVTGEQKEVMIFFMEQHPDFAKSKLLGPDGKKMRAALWEVLTTELNSVGGPKKSSAKWQRVWIDLKNKAKTKASAIRRSQHAIGGGPQSSQRLTDFEERMMAFLTEEAVHGLEVTAGLALDSEEIIPANLLKVSLDEPVAGPSTEYLPIAGLSSESATSFEVIARPLSATDSHGLTLVKEYVISEDDVSEPEPRTPGSYDDTSNEGHTPTPKQRKKKKAITRQQAFQTFAGLSERLNANIEGVLNRLDTQNEIRRETNNLLKELIDVLKNKTN